MLPRFVLRWFIRFRLIVVSLIIGLFITACQPASLKMHELEIIFTPYFARIPIECGQAIILQDQDWQILAFSMFLSEFSLSDSSTIILDDNDWQSQQVGLIRAAVNCQNPSGNMSVTGAIHAASHGDDSNTEGTSVNDVDIQVRNLKKLASGNGADSDKPIMLNFAIGLPFALNHQNPLIQASPLNDSSMFWAWRNGYKFIRWDMQSKRVKNSDSAASNSVNEAWSLHLGSVGCESAAMVRAPKKVCAKANLVPVSLLLTERSVSLEATSAQNTRLVLNIELHLDQIIRNIKLNRNNACMFSGIDNLSCNKLLENLKREAVFQ